MRKVTRRRQYSGIYVIFNMLSGKRYVGSAVDIFNRWSVHETSLKMGKHHSYKLQRAWNKYGAGVFLFETVEFCKRGVLVAREQFWIDAYDAYRKGYNVVPLASSTLGWVPTAKTRRRMSQGSLVAANTPEQKKMRSERAKRQHSEGKLGRVTWEPGTVEIVNKKIAAAQTGIGFKQYWIKPESRAKQSIKLGAYCSSNPEEMARRARVYWDRLTSEERKAHSQKAVSGRKDVQRKRKRLLEEAEKQ